MLRRARLAAVSLAALAFPASVAAQDQRCDLGDPEVRSVTFAGNRHFSSTQLSAAIVTTASSFTRRIPVLPFGVKHCLDPQELRLDVLRLRAFYRLRGYYETRVDTLLDRRTPRTVQLSFKIVEGRPVPIDTLVVTGLDHVPDGRSLANLLLSLKGGPYDRSRIAALEDTILTRLRDEGYAHAERPFTSKQVHDTTHVAAVTDSFPTGPVAYIDSIDIRIEPNDPRKGIAIPAASVRSLLVIKKGDRYRESALLESQRRLYQLETYRHVEIMLDSASARNQKDSALTLVVRLAEADMHAVRVGMGWGTYDCFRPQARYTDRDFLGGARRLDLDVRLSKIGLNRRTNQAICPSLAKDEFSRRINYYAGATFRPPTLFGFASVSPSFSLYSELRSEFDVYQRQTTIGGLASAARDLAPRTPVTVSYQLESGKTTASAAAFCTILNVCDVKAIERAGQSSTLQAVSLSLTRDRTDNPVDPVRGSIARLESRFVFTSTPGVSTPARFNRFLGELSSYSRFGNLVFAGRLQLAGIVSLGTFSGPSDFVPPQERLYAGGPSSVRGYDQNQLGPIVYVVDKFTVKDGQYVADSSIRVTRRSPIGGNALAVANAELRAPSPFLPDLLQWVGFVDVGQVWNRQNEIVNFRQLRATPGFGVRLRTPVGPARVDLAYRPNSREAGPAYFIPPPVNGVQQALVCVSPGQPVVASGTTASDCRSTFREPRGSFWSRLSPQISIGQAF
ncbi:MAG: BamA/TamA family outer membrane protein [Gemmatimonadaceae bacterium]